MKLFCIWVVVKMSFKIFLMWSSGSPPFLWSRTICAIFEIGHHGNIHEKLYGIRTGRLATFLI